MPLHFTLLSISNVLQSVQNVKDFSYVLVNYCPFATQALGFLLNCSNVREPYLLTLLVVLIVSLVTITFTSITTIIVDRNDLKECMHCQGTIFKMYCLIMFLVRWIIMWCDMNFIRERPTIVQGPGLITGSLKNPKRIIHNSIL